MSRGAMEDQVVPVMRPSCKAVAMCRILITSPPVCTPPGSLSPRLEESPQLAIVQTKAGQQPHVAELLQQHQYLERSLNDGLQMLEEARQADWNCDTNAFVLYKEALAGMIAACNVLPNRREHYHMLVTNALARCQQLKTWRKQHKAELESKQLEESEWRINYTTAAAGGSVVAAAVASICSAAAAAAASCTAAAAAAT